MKRTAFTLIELLIVVAIIGILAAIAVPNFLQAQTRARVARMESDMRTVGLAIETYRVDCGRYPIQPPPEMCNIALDGLPQLSTPTAYLTGMPDDLFFRPEEWETIATQPVKYGICTSGAPYWYLWSVGPDHTNDYAQLIYQSSNGLISPGDLKRTTAHELSNTNPQ